MNHTYDEAAEALNLPVRWLREHIKSLPHTKFGHFVRFTDEHIAAINAMHEVAPVREGATLTILRQAAVTRQTKRTPRRTA